MTTVRGEIKFPPRSYKTVEEFSLPENQSLRRVNVKYFTEIDQCVHASVEGSKIVEFFDGKFVFLTGATGFIGKLLMEKLLRTCKEIEKIYILVRPKKGEDSQTRMEKTFEDPVFSEMKKKVDDYRNKVVLIEGDVSKANLGMSRENRRKLIENVNVIIHGAATVNFNAPLRKAAAVNVNGTKELMLLAHQCKQLLSLVYISTAYSNCVHKEIEEKFYDPPVPPEEFLQMIDNNTDKYLSENQKSIIGKWPNTYSFSKALAENIIETMAGTIPTSVCRPAIVVSTYREPIRGWIDNIYGPSGFIIGVGTGVLRVSIQDNDIIMDLIPGDIVANGILAAACQNQFNSKGITKIYNFVSSQQNPIRAKDFDEMCKFYGQQIPSTRAIWHIMHTAVTNVYTFLILEFFLHFIPAMLMDCYLTLVGKKRRMLIIRQKLKDFMYLSSYFSTREWKMHNENALNLWKSTSEKDKEIFNFGMDPSNFNWNTYMSTAVLGLREYLLKEKMDTIPAARKKHQRLYCAHVAVTTVIFLLVSTIAYYIFRSMFGLI